MPDASVDGSAHDAGHGRRRGVGEEAAQDGVPMEGARRQSMHRTIMRSLSMALRGWPSHQRAALAIGMATKNHLYAYNPDSC